MLKHANGHHDPFPRASRTDDIKHRLREKLKTQKEDEAALARAAAEAEALRVAEEEAVRAEEVRLQAEAEAAKQSHRPWHSAKFTIQQEEAPATKEVAEADTPSEPEVVELNPTEAERVEEQREETVERGLEAIYLDANKGEVPDLTRLDRRRSSWWLWAIIGLATLGAMLSLAAWTGFFLARPFQEYRGGGLKVSIAGPAEVALGREEVFTVAWSNEDQNPLQHADLRLGLPQDFIVTSFDPAPTNAEARQWDLGLLPVGTQAEIKIKGVFIGALGTTSAIQSVASFRPTGFEKEFESLATLPILYKETVLVGAFIAPPKVVAGDAVTLKFEVGNQGATAMEGLLARIRYPNGFVPNVPSSVIWSPADRELYLPFPKLGSHATATIDLQGTFASGASGDLEFLAEAGRRGPDGSFLPSQRTEARIPVLAGDLTLRLIANGGDTDRTILPGDPLRITIGYQNTSPEPLKDVVLHLSFESELNGVSATGTSLLRWEQLVDVTRGVTSTKSRIQSIRYTKETIAALAELAPQSQGTIEVSIPTLAVASGTSQALVRLALNGEVPTVGSTRVNRTVRVQPIAFRYRSDASFHSSAWYFTEEGAPLGFGPLPPVVGKTTAYRVTWRIAKTLHALQGLKVTATLPKIVAWSARTFPEAGEIAYDETTRSVSWTLNQMPDGVKELEASFEVQLTPEAVDEGRFASLLGDAKLEALDPVVNEKIVLSRPALSTDLQNDEGAKGKGVVKKE